MTKALIGTTFASTTRPLFPGDDRTLTARQAAEFLGLSDNNLRKMGQRGPTKQTDGTYLVGDIRAWATSRVKYRDLFGGTPRKAPETAVERMNELALGQEDREKTLAFARQFIEAGREEIKELETKLKSRRREVLAMEARARGLERELGLIDQEQEVEADRIIQEVEADMAKELPPHK